MSRKKNIDNKLIILIALIFIGILFSTFYFVRQSVGGTILSIDNARIVSNSPDLNYEDGYLIDLVINRGGESLVGEITPEDIQKFGLTEIPKGPFKIYLDLKNVSCDYNILTDRADFTNAPSTDAVIFKLYQATVRHSLGCGRCGGIYARDPLSASCPYTSVSLDTVKKACRGQWGKASRTPYMASGIVHCPQNCNKDYAPEGTDNPTVGSPPPTPLSKCDALIEIQKSTTTPQSGADPGEWCYPSPPEIFSQNVAWCQGSCDKDHWRVMHIAGLPMFYGYKIDSVATPKFVAEITIENSNGTRTTTTITSDQLVNNLGDIGRVKFVGNLIAQQFCPVPSVDKAIIKDIDTGKMKVVKKRFYDDYLNTFESLVRLTNEGFAHRGTDPRDSRDVLQSYMERANNRLSDMYYGNVSDNCKIVGNNIYRCKPEHDVIYPELQLLVKASWIGVYIPSGKPEITNVKVKPAYANEVGRVEVSFRNVANETDSFDVGLICDNGNIGLGTQRVSVDSGKSTTVYLGYAGDVNIYDCKVKVQSVNNFANYDMSDSTSIKIDERPNKTINLPVCENVPKQPCAKAIWQAYPRCEWNSAFCVEEKKSNTPLIIGGIVAGLVILSLIVALIKKR